MRRYQDIIIKMAEETETMTNTTYYQINKQKIQEQYASKREDKLAYQIEYNLINRDKYLDYQKSYYESKKDEILRMKREKITCECGKLVSMGYMTAHKKTKKHCAFKALATPVPEPSSSPTE
jgi:hypothetical protein